MTDQTNSLTQAPVNRMLFKMAAPISLGMMSTFLFQIVDTYFVGQLGSDELAALAFSSTAYFMFISVFIGLSIGVSSVVAKAAGAGDDQKVRLLSTVTLVLVVVLSIGASLAARAAITPMFTGLGASETVLPMINDYMGILYLGFPFLMVGLVGSGAARATGTLILTEVVFGIAGVINLVFDYLLIFGVGPFPEMGLTGAAVATVMSFVFIFVGMMMIMLRKGLIGFGLLRNAKDGLLGLLDIAKISLPTIGMQLLVPATGMFTTFLLAGYGSEVVAAFGVAGRIEALAMIGIFAVSSAMTPFVAQNFGADEHDRIDQAVVFAGKASIYMGVVIFAILAILGPRIAAIFSDDPDVIRFVTFYFRIVALSYGFYGILNVTSAIFNGLQLPLLSLRLMLVKTIIFTVPPLIIASYISVTAILVALALGNILAGIYAGYEMRRSERKFGRPIADVNPAKDILQDFKRLLRAK